MSDPALRIEPLIRLIREIGNTPLLEELRRNAFGCRFVSNVLRAVLTKLEM